MKTCVLAFSGGLDTSYCVLRLKEDGYRVVTLYAHTGGADPEAQAAIGARAAELGVEDHRTVDAGETLWRDIVLPFLAGGARRQGRYPILCADRYLIAAETVALADAIGADAIAHGCTGMGNDQVRFDVSLAALSEKPILAPIRDLQARGDVRAYEEVFLRERGFGVPARAKQFSVNENLLGATLSGGAIDRFEAPPAAARVFTAPPEDQAREPAVITLSFETGVPAALSGEPLQGPALLDALNRQAGRYGIGYGIYTGDTLVGLKGRIVFEAPGLSVLEAAHTALCEAVSSRAQNALRRRMGEAWCDLIYDGFYFDPVRTDIEAYLASSQAHTSGEVDVRLEPGAAHAIAVRSAAIPARPGAVYAQSAAWSGEAAQGFTELFGQSTVLTARRSRP